MPFPGKAHALLTKSFNKLQRCISMFIMTTYAGKLAAANLKLETMAQISNQVKITWYVDLSFSKEKINIMHQVLLNSV